MSETNKHCHFHCRKCESCFSSLEAFDAHIWDAEPRHRQLNDKRKHRGLFWEKLPGFCNLTGAGVLPAEIWRRKREPEYSHRTQP